MSNLSPSMLVLDKGLNLQTAKILAPKGTMLDGLNYEQVDFQGQKRIDGYARYDGNLLPAIDDFVVVASDNFTVSEAAADIALNSDGVPFGIVLEELPADDAFAMAVLNENALPEHQTGVDYLTSAEEHYEAVLYYTSLLRDRVEQLPGGIIGLHWFRDRLYAVADLLVLEATGDILPNDSLVYNFGSSTTRALDYVVDEGTGYVLVPLSEGIGSFTVQRTGEEVTVNAVHAGIKASFFESRTEQQVLDEDVDADSYDFGWRFKHLGWRVPFVEGNSVYGSLTSLNQNRQGIGIQGPTTITGENGRPLFLTQKVSITNLPIQVNGWKTSTAPNVYSLEAGALDEIDGSSIYADAFFSWTADSSTPSAPGISGEGLIEYPANNTVTVDV